MRTTHFPSGPVNTLKEAFAHPQVQHLGLIQTIKHEKYGNVRLAGLSRARGIRQTLLGPPVEYSELENKVRTPPPLLGEHTKEVLKKELDLSEAELDDLKSRNVIDF